MAAVVAVSEALNNQSKTSRYAEQYGARVAATVILAFLTKKRNTHNNDYFVPISKKHSKNKVLEDLL
jgi:hypothetical protein